LRLLVATTAYPLPERDGLDLLTAGLLRQLRIRHQVRLVAMVRDDSNTDRHAEVCDDLVPVHAPRSGLWARLHQEVMTLPTRRPILAEQATEALSRPVARAAEAFKPDLVHFIQSWTAELVRAVPDAATVLSALDASGPNWRERIEQRGTPIARYLGRRELSRMLRYERDCYPRVDRVVMVTEEDSALVRAISPRSRVSTVSNGIDARHWKRPADLEREPGLVVFTGNLAYPPNVSAALFAAREVLPRLRQMRPHAHLRLVGRDPDPQILALDGSDIEVTGTVPDVRPHLWEASAYVCPMTGGSGVKNKLMEAMAAGCPCVATARATFGLGLRNEEHVLLGERPNELAHQLDRVLSDASLATGLSAHAASRIEALTWEAVAQAYEQIYAEVLADRSR
jgi:glycosyltransferase involved in cell wall biosynthesis